MLKMRGLTQQQQQPASQLQWQSEMCRVKSFSSSSSECLPSPDSSENCPSQLLVRSRSHFLFFLFVESPGEKVVALLPCLVLPSSTVVQRNGASRSKSCERRNALTSRSDRRSIVIHRQTDRQLGKTDAGFLIKLNSYRQCDQIRSRVRGCPSDDDMNPYHNYLRLNLTATARCSYFLYPFRATHSRNKLSLILSVCFQLVSEQLAATATGRKSSHTQNQTHQT